MVRDRIDACSTCQSQPEAETTRRTLTVDDQSGHILSIAYGAIERFHFEDVENVRPVQAFLLGLDAVLVEDDQVGREFGFVDDPTSEPFRVPDMIILRDSASDGFGVGPRQGTENSIRGLHQRSVEQPFQRARIAKLAVLLVVFLEPRVCFDRFDIRTP